jgi:hypothetical protein
MSGYPDVIGFTATLVDTRKPGTALATVPIRKGSKDEGDVPPFVVLGTAGAVRSDALPILSPARVQGTVYGRTEWEADELYRALSDLLHRAGPYVTDEAGLYRTYDETGPQPSVDPDTAWPTAFGVFDLYMTDRSI